MAGDLRCDFAGTKVIDKIAGIIGLVAHLQGGRSVVTRLWR